MDTPINIIEEITTVTIGDEITTVSISEITTIIETNTQGPPGPPGEGNTSSGEIPIGNIDGINTNYVLANTPINEAKIYVNGMRQKDLVDYTISSNIVSFISPLIPGDILLADYNY